MLLRTRRTTLTTSPVEEAVTATTVAPVEAPEEQADDLLHIVCTEHQQPPYRALCGKDPGSRADEQMMNDLQKCQPCIKVWAAHSKLFHT